MTTERRVAARAGDQASMRRLSYVAPRELRWEDAPAPRLPSDYAALAGR